LKTFLSARAKLEKMAIRIRNEIRNLSSFRKSVDRIQVPLQSDNINGHFYMKTYVLYIYDNISLNSP